MLKAKAGSGLAATVLGALATLSGILGIVGFFLPGIFWMLAIALGMIGLCCGLVGLLGPNDKEAKVGIVGSLIGLALAAVQILLVGLSFARQ